MPRSLEKLLTVAETAEFLGTTPKTIYDWKRDGLIPFRVVGRKGLRFSPTELEEWTKEGARA